MCTVTYIPTSSGKLITSNRDEHGGRATALAPITETCGNVKISYPKDPKSGGTWIAAKNNGEVAVLLNGAFENHEKCSSYSESRGTVFLKIISSTSPIDYFKQTDLFGIENFTLILYKTDVLMECRWDGAKKHIETKDHNKPYLWSSATLYPKAISNERAQWFSRWLSTARNLDQKQVIDFHHFAGDGDPLNGLIMCRENGISTVSITSVFVGRTQMNMHYEDLKSGKKARLDLSTATVKSSKLFLSELKLKLRIVMIKTLNWEYWPMHVVYAPMYLYWFYLSAKARSLFFFSAANPMRHNAGFAMERKSDSYKHLSQKLYPRTLICNAGMSAPTLKTRMDDKNLVFPVIAKPEMGERGTGVKLIENLDSLVRYSQNSHTAFLVQEFISHPHEVGIFYCRLPAEKHGKITGIVGKQLLSVIGDGKATIKELLLRDNRHLLQLKTLAQELPHSLTEILAKNEEQLLVPYGNHCRGAMFKDLSHLISDQLTMVIDRLCKQLPGFYFGRLDIKFSNWEQLEKGNNFSVIELNGAASEPTHMYDPKHSIFFAWKEIRKHWDLLYKISLANAKTNKLPLMNIAEGMEMLRAHRSHIKGLSAANSNQIAQNLVFNLKQNL